MATKRGGGGGVEMSTRGRGDFPPFPPFPPPPGSNHCKCLVFIGPTAMLATLLSSCLSLKMCIIDLDQVASWSDSQSVQEQVSVKNNRGFCVLTLTLPNTIRPVDKKKKLVSKEKSPLKDMKALCMLCT